MKKLMILVAATTSLGLLGCPDKDSAAPDPAAAKPSAATPAAVVAPPPAKPAAPAAPAATKAGGW